MAKMRKLNQLVVLDVEGTIRYLVQDEKTKVTRVQHQDVGPVFQKLKSIGCEIVLASNLKSEEYVWLREEFKSVGIDQYISYYEPEGKPADGGVEMKSRKVQKYIKEYAARGVTILPEQVRFYDDVEMNVQMLKINDYKHAYLVDNGTLEASLVSQLTALVHELENENSVE